MVLTDEDGIVSVVSSCSETASQPAGLCRPITWWLSQCFNEHRSQWTETITKHTFAQQTSSISELVPSTGTRGGQTHFDFISSRWTRRVINSKLEEMNWDGWKERRPWPGPTVLYHFYNIYMQISKWNLLVISKPIINIWERACI